MKEVKFKVGDLVYCPNLTAGIVKLRHTLAYQESRKKLDSIPFYVFEFSYLPFDCANGGFLYCVNENGCHGTNQKPIIFHATQENYELLSKLYPNVAFEPPPKQKEPKEIIKAMFDSGWACVPCYAGDREKILMSRHKKELITSIENDWFNNWAGVHRFAVPFDPKTGKIIIDFVNGEVVLESENDVSYKTDKG